MKALLKGLGLLLLFTGQGAFTLLHVAFSSVYQNALVVSRQLQEELRQLREQHDEQEF